MGNAASNKVGRGVGGGSASGGISAKSMRKQQRLQQKQQREQQHYGITTTTNAESSRASKRNLASSRHLASTPTHQQQQDFFASEPETPPPHLYDLDLDHIWPPSSKAATATISTSPHYYASSQLTQHVRNPARRSNRPIHHKYHLQKQKQQFPKSAQYSQCPSRASHPASNFIHSSSVQRPDYLQPSSRVNPIYLDSALDYPQPANHHQTTSQQDTHFVGASSYDLISGGLTTSSSHSSSRSTAQPHPVEAYETPAFAQAHHLQHRPHHHQLPSSASNNLYNFNLNLHQFHQQRLISQSALGPSSPLYEDCDYSMSASQHQLANMHITQPSTKCQDGSCCSAANGARVPRPASHGQQQTRRGSDGTNGTAEPPPLSHLLSDLERGLALTEEERNQRGLLGLLPAAVQGQELQSQAVINFIDNCQDELAKYVYLRNLKDFNEKLFYHTLMGNVQKLMPLVYTPTVGLACQRFSEIYMRPRGLFVTANDAGRVQQVVNNWPERDVRVIVVTDGERILGLGDLGANGMGISIGKLSLYTALAGISPQNVMPVTIDVGTNNEAYLKDPFYIGLRQPRIRGSQFDALIEEFMQAVVQRWGRSCLIQFEDFANSTAFNLLKRYRQDYCTFNDDIQGTASVALSGLITAARGIGKRLADCTFLFYGAGEANLGTAHLLIMAMADDGLTREEAQKRIWLVDSKGLIVKSREDLNEHKRELAQEAQPLRDLEQIIDHVKPLAIIGASAQPGTFTESICKKMAQYNEKCIIFALSNPTSKAECTAAQAYEWTQGRCVFASGSPFDPVPYGGKTYVTGQGNNAYVFPGVGLAAIGAHTHIVPEETFLVAARALSDQVTAQDTEVGLVYPSLTKIREVTLNVATRVLEFFYAERLATYRPEPSNKHEFLKGIRYDPTY